MLKRLFDIVFSFTALILFSWIILISWVFAAFDTKSNGLFFQKRVGQFGKLFTIVKLRTIRKDKENVASISGVGAFLRNSKLDELPQFINVLLGDMSVVGPRPDIEGYYDCLEGEERKILELKPGLTSEASLKYFNEEQILALQENALEYNDRVLFPDKVRLNLQYYYNQTFFGDVKIIIKTLFHKMF